MRERERETWSESTGSRERTEAEKHGEWGVPRVGELGLGSVLAQSVKGSKQLGI